MNLAEDIGIRGFGWPFARTVGLPLMKVCDSVGRSMEWGSFEPVLTETSHGSAGNDISSRTSGSTGKA